MAKPKQPPGPPDTVSEREPDKNLRTVYAKLSVEWEKKQPSGTKTTARPSNDARQHARAACSGSNDV